MSMAPPYVCTGDKGSLYDQFHKDVAGSGQLGENAQIFESLAQEYNNQKFELQNALQQVKVTYTGHAAEQMQGAFQPLIESVGQGFDLCRRSANLVQNQGGGFDSAQAAIQPPAEVPEKPWYNGAVPWNTDHDDAVEKNSGIDAANQQAFSRYIEQTNGNNDGAPTFETQGAPGIGNVAVVEGQPVAPGTPGVGAPNSGGSGGSSGGGGSFPARFSGTLDAPVPPPAVGPPSGSTTPNDFVSPPPQSGLHRPPPGVLPPAASGQPGIQPGFTGGFGPVGGGGSGGLGARGGAGGFGGTGGQTPRGPGGMIGGGAPDGERLAGRPGAAGAAAGARSGGAGGMGAGAPMGGRGGQDDDREHQTAAYLTNEANGSEIIGDLPATVPSVIE